MNGPPTRRTSVRLVRCVSLGVENLISYTVPHHALEDAYGVGLESGDIYQREDDALYWCYHNGWHGPFTQREQAIVAARLLT